jgi:energy-coupling factor transport system substrate-specific component
MSWTLAALVILGICLFFGFWWYERQHPPAKVVALVATLAALAALGRVAFAPLPSVKPTTTIVLIAGFALGAAPGFTVGAVAALASNLFFGQGPWTPWQMVAWGLCGVLGAGIATVLGGKLPRRVPLGLWCAAAALGFGAIMDLSTWTTFGRHTFSEYVVISGTALPFNLTHAVGSFAFAVAFGPALLGALERFRMRFEVEWGELRPTQESMRFPIG